MLAHPPSQKGTHIAKVLHQVAETIHKRSLVIIFSDMMGAKWEIEMKCLPHCNI